MAQSTRTNLVEPEAHPNTEDTYENDPGVAFQHPLHCVRDYGNRQYLDAQRVADETVTFLRSFSQRLERFRNQTGQFARTTQPNGRTHTRPASRPPATTKMTTSTEANHATGGKISPAKRSTPSTKHCNPGKSPTPVTDTTTSEHHSISMERPVCTPVTIGRKHHGLPKPVPVPQVISERPPRIHGNCTDGRTRSSETTDGSNGFHPAATEIATNVDTHTSDVGERKPPSAEGMKMERLTEFLQDLKPTNDPSSVTTVMTPSTNLAQPPAGSPPAGSVEGEGGDEPELGKFEPGPTSQRDNASTEEGSLEKSQLTACNLPSNTPRQIKRQMRTTPPWPLETQTPP